MPYASSVFMPSLKNAEKRGKAAIWAKCQKPSLLTVWRDARDKALWPLTLASGLVDMYHFERAVAPIEGCLLACISDQLTKNRSVLGYRLFGQIPARL